MFKTIILTAFSLTVATMLCACMRNEIRSHSIELPTMTDDKSADEIAELLNRTHGVLKFTLDIDSQVAYVEFHSRLIAEKNIEVALARAGYTANSVYAFPAPDE